MKHIHGHCRCVASLEVEIERLQVEIKVLQSNERHAYALVRKLADKWREVDWHWSREFCEVAPTWQEHKPSGDDEIELLAMAAAEDNQLRTLVRELAEELEVYTEHIDPGGKSRWPAGIGALLARARAAIGGE